jgi:hypothetical protein
MEHFSDYDEETNILYIRYGGSPVSDDDIQFILTKDLEGYELGKGMKVWVIFDFTDVKIGKPKLITKFASQRRKQIEKYAIDFCTISTKLLTRVANLLFNTAIGERHPIFAKFEKAREWIFEQQGIRGVSEPVKDNP